MSDREPANPVAGTAFLSPRIIDGAERVGGKEAKIEVQGTEDCFTYMVGTYAIKPFLRKLDVFAVDLQERRLEEARRKLHDSLEELCGYEIKLRVKERLKNNQARIEAFRKTLLTKLKNLCARLRRRKRELCFGEIESGEDLTRQISPTAEFRCRNKLNKCLLWYYGSEGVLAFRAAESMRLVQGEKTDETEMQVWIEPPKLWF
jgi:hypothetical protein